MQGDSWIGMGIPALRYMPASGRERSPRIHHIAPGGGYILATSNSITDSCKVENILALRDALKRYGRYPIDVPEA